MQRIIAPQRTSTYKRSFTRDGKLSSFTYVKMTFMVALVVSLLHVFEWEYLNVNHYLLCTQLPCGHGLKGLAYGAALVPFHKHGCQNI